MISMKKRGICLILLLCTVFMTLGGYCKKANAATTFDNTIYYGSYEATDDNIDRMLRGLAPIGKDGYSVELHHWDGIARDFNNYSPITRTLHRLIHHDASLFDSFLEYWGLK